MSWFICRKCCSYETPYSDITIEGFTRQRPPCPMWPSVPARPRSGHGMGRQLFPIPGPSPANSAKYCQPSTVYANSARRSTVVCIPQITCHITLQGIDGYAERRPTGDLFDGPCTRCRTPRNVSTWPTRLSTRPTRFEIIYIGL